MSKKTLRYRDTIVAHGSQLYDALERGDNEAAEKIYQECDKEYRKYNKPPRVYTVEDLPELLNERLELLDLQYANKLSESGRVRLEKLRNIADSLEESRNGKGQ